VPRSGRPSTMRTRGVRRAWSAPTGSSKIRSDGHHQAHC
jgi:hypothetical protein